MLQTLMTILTDPNADPDSRSGARDALVSLIEANPQVATQETIQTLVSFCRADQDSFLRQAAARLLFVIAIREPAQKNMIRDVFTQLQASSQPHLRMNGERGIEMLAIGDLLEEARLHPDHIPELRSRLNAYQEDDLQFAASIVQNEIYKLENKSK
jgi:hypothetical protein